MAENRVPNPTPAQEVQQPKGQSMQDKDRKPIEQDTRTRGAQPSPRPALPEGGCCCS
jgi:hypothetical protein